MGGVFDFQGYGDRRTERSSARGRPKQSPRTGVENKKARTRTTDSNVRYARRDIYQMLRAVIKKYIIGGAACQYTIKINLRMVLTFAIRA